MMRLRHLFFALVWAAAVATGFWLYGQGRTGEGMGQVESVVHVVAADEPALIAEIIPAIGDQVEAGQPIARIDHRDLDELTSRLDQQLRQERDLLSADRQLGDVDFTRFQVERDHEARRLHGEALAARQVCAEAATAVAAGKAETAALGQEIDRLNRAGSVGLGHADEVARLAIRRDTLVGAQSGREAALADAQGKLNHATAAERAWVDIATATLRRNPAFDRQARIAGLEGELGQVRERLRRRTLVAPCLGIVVAIHARAGTAVGPASPVLSVQEITGRWLDAYWPEGVEFSAAIGDRVLASSQRRGRQMVGGTITAVQPGFVPLPALMLPRPLPINARLVRIRLDNAATLLPGERVAVRLGAGHAEPGAAPPVDAPASGFSAATPTAGR